MGEAARILVVDDEEIIRFALRSVLASLQFEVDCAESVDAAVTHLGARDYDPDAGRCEVTRALVAVRKLTGRVAPNSKFPDPEEPTVLRALDEAQRIFEEEKDRLQPVVVI